MKVGINSINEITSQLRRFNDFNVNRIILKFMQFSSTA